MSAEALIIVLIVVAAVALATVLNIRRRAKVVLVLCGLALAVISSATARMSVAMAYVGVTLLQEANYGPAGSPAPADVKVRYRFEVSLRINGKIRTSSAVHQLLVRATGFDGNTTIPAVRTTFYGDALEFALPDNRVLVILLVLKSADDYRNFYISQCDLFHPQGPVSELIRRLATFGGRCSVQKRDMPRMIIIEDPSDSTTIKEAKFEELEDVDFVSAGIARTEEPITDSIRNKYAWLADDEWAAINVAPDSTVIGIYLMKYWFYGLSPMLP